MKCKEFYLSSFLLLCRAVCYNSCNSCGCVICVFCTCYQLVVLSVACYLLSVRCFVFSLVTFTEQQTYTKTH